MKTNLIVYFIIFLQFFFTNCNGQITKKIDINLGIATRPEVWELTNYQVRGGAIKGYQFKGFSRMKSPFINFEIVKKIKDSRWSIQVSNYFTYNYQVTEVDTLNIPIKDISSVKYDFFIDGKYRFLLSKKKNTILHLGLGIGRVNIGKRFSYNYPTGERDQNGKYIFIPTSTNLSFWAPRFLIGTEKNRIGAYLSVIGIPDEDLEPNPTLWLEMKLLYKFEIFNKK